MLFVFRDQTPAYASAMEDLPGRAAPAGAGIIAILVCAAMLFLAGCGSKPRTLETGYQYEPLNSTGIERRAFYADPYSLEARRAESERQQRASETGGFGIGP